MRSKRRVDSRSRKKTKRVYGGAPVPEYTLVFDKNGSIKITTTKQIPYQTQTSKPQVLFGENNNLSSIFFISWLDLNYTVSQINTRLRLVKIPDDKKTSTSKQITEFVKPTLVKETHQYTFSGISLGISAQVRTRILDKLSRDSTKTTETLSTPHTKLDELENNPKNLILPKEKETGKETETKTEKELRQHQNADILDREEQERSKIAELEAAELNAKLIKLEAELAAKKQEHVANVQAISSETAQGAVSNASKEIAKRTDEAHTRIIRELEDEIDKIKKDLKDLYILKRNLQSGGKRRKSRKRRLRHRHPKQIGP